VKAMAGIIFLIPMLRGVGELSIMDIGSL